MVHQQLYQKTTNIPIKQFHLYKKSHTYILELIIAAFGNKKYVSTKQRMCIHVGFQQEFWINIQCITHLLYCFISANLGENHDHLVF